MRKSKVGLMAIAFALTGCSTSTYVKLPVDAHVQFDSRAENYQQGRVERRPFQWSAASGIPYKVEKDGVVLSEGKLTSKFRVASIFWPPPACVAMIYWPMGFGNTCYDLTGDKPATCSPPAASSSSIK